MQDRKALGGANLSVAVNGCKTTVCTSRILLVSHMYVSREGRHVSTPYYTKYAVVYDTYVITYLRQKHRIHTVLPHTVIRFEIAARSAEIFCLKGLKRAWNPPMAARALL